MDGGVKVLQVKPKQSPKALTKDTSKLIHTPPEGRKLISVHWQTSQEVVPIKETERGKVVVIKDETMTVEAGREMIVSPVTVTLVKETKVGVQIGETKMEING